MSKITNPVLLAARAPVDASVEQDKQVEAQRAMTLQQAYTFLPALQGAFMLAGGVEDWKASHHIWSCWHEWAMPPRPWAELTINAYCKVSAWGDLTQLFEVLDAAGIDLPIGGWTSQDDAQSWTRIFKSTPVDTPTSRINIQIHASLPGDTDTCHRVIVGYEREDREKPARPIYELRCDGEGPSASDEELPE